MGPREFPLESDEDLTILSGILRLATKYGAKHMRDNALQVLRRKFPSSLSDWDSLAENARFRWTCDPIPVINLVREVSAFSPMPAAMAFLTNNSSAGEVFAVQVHEGTGQRSSLHKLRASEDIKGFALMKEYDHASVVKMINFIREVGSNCKQPPEPESRPNGMSPVGTLRHEFRASICSGIFHEVADNLALKFMMREDPMGYRDFGMMVLQDVMSQRRPICRRCRVSFKTGYVEHRDSWWNGIPHILGLPDLRGWGEDHT